MTATQAAANTNVKWPEIKVDIIKAWGKLNDTDLEKTKGDFKEISTLLQRNYGDTNSSYSGKLSEIFKRFADKNAEVPNVKVEAATAEVVKPPMKN